MSDLNDLGRTIRDIRAGATALAACRLLLKWEAQHTGPIPDGLQVCLGAARDAVGESSGDPG